MDLWFPECLMALCTRFSGLTFDFSFHCNKQVGVCTMLVFLLACMALIDKLRCNLPLCVL